MYILYNNENVIYKKMFKVLTNPPAFSLLKIILLKIVCFQYTLTSCSQTFWSQDPYMLLNIIENPKELLFMLKEFYYENSFDLTDI